MKKEDCKVGLEVIVNYPGRIMNNCTGKVVGMGVDKASVAINGFAEEVWDFAYSNIEPYSAAKLLFQVGNMVTICQPDSKANGCVGIITEKLSDKANELGMDDRLTELYARNTGATKLTGLYALNTGTRMMERENG